MISIITPWLNGSELIPDYERSHMGAQIITVDNASEPEHAKKIKEMTARMGGTYIKNKTNKFFSKANNQGFKKAKHDIVLFLNNDTRATPGWINQVVRDVKPGGLYGQSSGVRIVGGVPTPYLEGWCIAATKATWETIGLWPDNLPGLYWEDNIVCLNALKHGVKLYQKNWYVEHINNYTSSKTKGAYDHSKTNQETFERMVIEWRS